MLYYNCLRAILCAPMMTHGLAAVTHSDNSAGNTMDTGAWLTDLGLMVNRLEDHVRQQLNRAVPVMAIPARIARWVPLAVFVMQKESEVQKV